MACSAPSTLRQVVPNRGDMRRLGDVEFEHLDVAVELACRAFGEAQGPSRSGEHDLGAFGEGHLGHTERERRVGEYAGDQDAFANE